jgi:hypothetical protein
MKKPILYRLFKVGRIPKQLQPVIESEGIVVSDEGISGWMLMKDFKAPGKRFKRRIDGFTGFLAVTQKRIISYLYGKPILDLPIKDPRITAITATLVKANQIELAFESSIFQNNWSGLINLRYNTAKAQEFYNTIQKIVRDNSPAEPQPANTIPKDN